ncbi:MAG: hypothetical protein ACFFCF_02600 [Promethearchaeota archaeon]
MAQPDLDPNVTLRYRHLWPGWKSDYYVELEAGRWTILVESDQFWGLEVKITVSLYSDFHTVLIDSGEGNGNYPVVSFLLNSSDTVYIRVSENADGGSSGFFDVGVYDDFHLLIRPFTNPFLMITIFIIIMVLVFFVIFSLVCFFSIKSRRNLEHISKESVYDVTQLPRQTRRILREQLPPTCPNCGGKLRYGSVKWVGPHTAECPYCGQSVPLELIDIEINEAE